MTRNRVPETDHGIQGMDIVKTYDEMQRYQRDQGWIQTQSIIDHGIQRGHALEIGHGPGYLGLEWLKNTRETFLTGVDISPEMTTLAEKNARLYELENRTNYQAGQGDKIPFPDNTFDAVFTNGSLHEWAEPEATFNEIFRVLKPGGKYFISDLRRDMPFFIHWFLWLVTKPTSIRPYLVSSINAAYEPMELKKMIVKTFLIEADVSGNLIGLNIVGEKPNNKG
jgi:ubiquinone/menaquinone biosynthesis C-methylase UbiE